MKIFCYGSNMSTKRITERCSSSRFITRAYVTGLKLALNKKGKDGSGKANLVTACDKSIVWGVIFDISEDQKPLLDKAEGLGKGYDMFQLGAISDTGGKIQCQCYIAKDPKFLDNNLRPLDWYGEFCLSGAKEHRLPQEWILTLEGLFR